MKQHISPSEAFTQIMRIWELISLINLSELLFLSVHNACSNNLSYAKHYYKIMQTQLCSLSDNVAIWLIYKSYLNT